MQNRFFELVKRKHERGVTIFFSSHILSEVQKVCDRVGIIKDGMLIQVQSVDELRTTKYKKVQLKMNQGMKFTYATDEIKNLKQQNQDVSFIYSGSVEKLIQLLSTQPIDDFSVAEPDLEEIFMHYYGEEVSQ